MPKSILVPVDLSPVSRNALRYALKLGRSLSASVEVLYVVPPRSFIAKLADAELHRPVRGADSEAVKEAERELVTFISSVPHEGVRLKYWVDPGDPASSIVQEACDERIDLIVMGTHGRTGLKAALLGSVAQAVVSCAKCPVTLVRG